MQIFKFGPSVPGSKWFQCTSPVRSGVDPHFLMIWHLFLVTSFCAPLTGAQLFQNPTFWRLAHHKIWSLSKCTGIGKRRRQLRAQGSPIKRHLQNTEGSAKMTPGPIKISITSCEEDVSMRISDNLSWSTNWCCIHQIKKKMRENTVLVQNIAFCHGCVEPMFFIRGLNDTHR